MREFLKTNMTNVAYLRFSYMFYFEKYILLSDELIFSHLLLIKKL